MFSLLNSHSLRISVQFSCRHLWQNQRWTLLVSETDNARLVSSWPNRGMCGVNNDCFCANKDHGLNHLWFHGQQWLSNQSGSSFVWLKKCSIYLKDITCIWWEASRNVTSKPFSWSRHFWNSNACRSINIFNKCLSKWGGKILKCKNSSFIFARFLCLHKDEQTLSRFRL